MHREYGRHAKEVDAIMIKKILIGLCFIGLGLIINIANAEAPERTLEQYSHKELVEYFATLYGANTAQLEAVIKCESNWRPTVYGDGGHAYGLLQFHKPTFDRWAKQMGEELDYYSAYDSIKLGAWAFAQGANFKDDWTCWTRLYA
jgi:soluble lytic murein transglycosylase-like protein